MISFVGLAIYKNIVIFYYFIVLFYCFGIFYLKRSFFLHVYSRGFVILNEENQSIGNNDKGNVDGNNKKYCDFLRQFGEV